MLFSRWVLLVPQLLKGSTSSSLKGTNFYTEMKSLFFHKMGLEVPNLKTIGLKCYLKKKKTFSALHPRKEQNRESCPIKC